MLNKLGSTIACTVVALTLAGLLQTAAPAANILATYPAAPGMDANTAFGVRVRTPGAAWQDLYAYNVKVNRLKVSDAAMVNFSFAGAVEMEVTYHGGAINSCEIRPKSFGIQAAQQGAKLTFSVTQNPSFPRKFVVIINGDLDHCLHVLGNPPEENAPSLTDTNVWPVEPGETLTPLPEGKDTYYFKPGIHGSEILGAWAELDLGQTHSIDRFDLVQKDFAHRFTVYVRNGLNEKYALAYDGTGNTADGTITKTFPAATGRYVKVQFLDHTGTNHCYATRVKEFRVYEAGGSTNLALNTFRVGSHAELKKIVDGDENTAFENNRAAGRLWLYANGQKIYLPGSAVIEGGVWGLGLSNIVIRGRGIIDGSKLRHTVNNDGANRVWPFITFDKGANITYEGFILLDHPSWGMSVDGSRNSKIVNVSQIAYDFNSDGIHLDGASGSEVRGCFIRTSDDIVCTHAGEDLLVENSVFWGDKAHIFFMGLDEHQVRRVTFRNIDVLGSYEEQPVYQGVMAIHCANGSSFEDITFEDIRVAPFRKPDRQVLVLIHMNNIGRWSRRPGKSVRNITLKNISYDGSGEKASIIQGADQARFVDGVHFINYRRQGALVTNAVSGNLTIGTDANHVDFK